MNMKLLYIIPIVIGFGIDIIDLGKWVIAFIKRTELPLPSFSIFSSFVLPAWGISGLMIFGREPEEVVKSYNSFLIALGFAFCVHLFIREALPDLVLMIGKRYYNQK